MRSFLHQLSAAFLLIVAGQAWSGMDGVGDEAFVFYPTWHGTFVTAELPRWGFTVDIQKGVLFATVFGYAASGDDAFLTMTSTPVDPMNPFFFEGDVNLTRRAAQFTTDDVGDFTLEAVTVEGQPGWLLTFDSPYASGQDIVLQRFGYLDADELSVLAGKRWLFAVAGELVPGEETDTAEFKFGDRRDTYPDGVSYLTGFTDSPADIANVFLDEDAGFYIVLLAFGDLPDVIFVLEVSVSHASAFGIAYVSFADGTLSRFVRGQGFVLTEDSVSTKALGQSEVLGMHERSARLYDRYVRTRALAQHASR